MLRTVTLLCLGGLAQAALAQPGTLDPTFGISGIKQIDVSANSEIGTDILPMADGRLLVCGYGTPFTNFPEPFILRLLPDGTLDPDYGIVMLSCGDRGEAWGMAFAPDSSVYVCGYADTLGYERVTLWRVLPDGTPDPSFGFNGRASVPSMVGNYRVWDMAAQVDGKLVLAGYYQATTRSSLLVRLNTDGTLDNSFSSDGLWGQNISATLNDEFLGVDVLDDGTIVAGGYATSTGTTEYPVLVKLNSMGEPDVTFDGDGILLPSTSLPSSRVATVAADGQHMIAAGARAMGISTTSDYYLLRVDDTGTFDQGFGTLGEQVTDVNPDDFINDLIILDDGRIVATGFSGDYTNGTGTIDFLTAVHNADGSLHTTFGGTGHVVTAATTGQDRGFAVKAQPDGKLVVCGYGSSLVTILRYENDQNTSATSRAQEAEIVTWPNPADDHLRLNTTITGAARVEILDATGRVVRSMSTTNANGLVIPIEDLQPGSYVLRCGASDSARTAAFIIAR